MDKEKLKGNHYCDNINCNHNNTEGLCLMFNPDVCKYRQLQKEYTELEKACDETQELLDKQIEVTLKLDKENADLEWQLQEVAKDNDNYQKENKELEKENAELKERLKEHESVGNSQFWKNVWSWKTKAIQLANAKEIIKKFSEFANNEIEYDPEHPQEHTDLWNKLCEQAEQFLNSEVEK